MKNIDEFGNPTLEYWKARRDMEDYVNGLTPSPVLKVFMQNIGRNMLLASLHTPLKTAIGVLVNTAFEGSVRRLSGGTFMSDVGFKMIKDYISNASEIYNKAGYNISTMTSLGDDRLFGEKRISAQGKGWFNKSAQVVTDIVINKLHGIQFTIMEAANFADSVALQATRIAKSEGLKGDDVRTRTEELFKEIGRASCRERV